MALATPASVCRPDTTSTSFISGTGLKKCMPTSRAGCTMPFASAVTEIDEVLVAITASSLNRPSSSANSARFVASCSTIASTTSRASAASCKVATGVMRASVASTAATSSLPFATRPARLSASLPFACAAAPSRASNNFTA